MEKETNTIVYEILSKMGSEHHITIKASTINNTSFIFSTSSALMPKFKRELIKELQQNLKNYNYNVTNFEDVENVKNFLVKFDITKTKTLNFTSEKEMLKVVEEGDVLFYNGKLITNENIMTLDKKIVHKLDDSVSVTDLDTGEDRKQTMYFTRKEIIKLLTLF